MEAASIVIISGAVVAVAVSYLWYRSNQAEAPLNFQLVSISFKITDSNLYLFQAPPVEQLPLAELVQSEKKRKGGSKKSKKSKSKRSSKKSTKKSKRKSKSKSKSKNNKPPSQNS